MWHYIQIRLVNVSSMVSKSTLSKLGKELYKKFTGPMSITELENLMSDFVKWPPIKFGFVCHLINLDVPLKVIWSSMDGQLRLMECLRLVLRKWRASWPRISRMTHGTSWWIVYYIDYIDYHSFHVVAYSAVPATLIPTWPATRVIRPYTKVIPIMCSHRSSPNSLSGAETPIYLALLPVGVDGPSGEYFSDKTRQDWK